MVANKPQELKKEVKKDVQTKDVNNKEVTNNDTQSMKNTVETILKNMH